MANKKLLTIVNGERVAIDSNATDLDLKSIKIDGVEIKKSSDASELDFGTKKLRGVADGTANDHAINYSQLQTEITNRNNAIADARGYTVEYITINPTQAALKSVELSGTPTKPERTLLDIIGGGAQKYTADFLVIGNSLSWSGTELDAILTEDDELRIVWF